MTATNKYAIMNNNLVAMGYVGAGKYTKGKNMAGYINVTRREFSESCRKHFKTYKGMKLQSKENQNTRRLVLFYAVECGLKSFILKTIGKNTYEELKIYSETEGKRMDGHNIKEMAKEVGIGEKFPLKKIQLEREGGNVQPERYHELWRYGVTVKNQTEEEREERTLAEMAEWLNQHI